MLIAIWGRDGIGKSTLADALGSLFMKHKITAIIDTDLTQPTLPMRLSGQHLDGVTSLGRAIAGIGTNDVPHYLHQHPRHKSLFYAGLTDKDDYLSYEIGLEADNHAKDFIEGCQTVADVVILDLSGQRTDPFVPCALIHADWIIIPVTPDVQGICWFNAVKPLIESMSAQGRILPVATLVDKHQNLQKIEKAMDMYFATALPYVNEFRQMRDTDASPLNGTTPNALRYAKAVRKLYTQLKGAESI
ncbi:MAG: hypothetical protein ACOYU3_01075 [Bacillota bacterium]